MSPTTNNGEAPRIWDVTEAVLTAVTVRSPTICQAVFRIIVLHTVCTAHPCVLLLHWGAGCHGHRQTDTENSGASPLSTRTAWNSTDSAKLSKTPPRAHLLAHAGRLREGRLRTLEHDRDNTVTTPVAAQAGTTPVGSVHQQQNLCRPEVGFVAPVTGTADGRQQQRLSARGLRPKTKYTHLPC